MGLVNEVSKFHPEIASQLTEIFNNLARIEELGLGRIPEIQENSSTFQLSHTNFLSTGVTHGEDIREKGVWLTTEQEQPLGRWKNAKTKEQIRITPSRFTIEVREEVEKTLLRKRRETTNFDAPGATTFYEADPTKINELHSALKLFNDRLQQATPVTPPQVTPPTDGSLNFPIG